MNATLTNHLKEKRNKVSFGKVLLMVAIQHAIQMAVGVALMKSHTSDHSTRPHFLVTILSQILLPFIHKTFLYQYMMPCIQFLCAMFIIDTYQYALHRFAHSNTFLYKHMHSHHHRLYAPYAFGALYNHPLEGFLMDSCGGALAFELTGMSPRLGMYFFIFSTLKTINDHCGYSFPWDPLTICFNNNVEYHNIHHQAYGIKTNFSQPFFVFWDVWLHTEYSQVMKSKLNKKKI
ncbi:fatty acid hydroxylase superfamily-domain-containing protein [Blakeslea trispora]|nr:fatty acid hydroxylase superfamily-domain-containing protein [Blakeslea trispora]